MEDDFRLQPDVVFRFHVGLFHTGYPQNLSREAAGHALPPQEVTGTNMGFGGSFFGLEMEDEESHHVVTVRVLGGGR